MSCGDHISNFDGVRQAVLPLKLAVFNTMCIHNRKRDHLKTSIHITTYIHVHFKS